MDVILLPDASITTINENLQILLKHKNKLLSKLKVVIIEQDIPMATELTTIDVVVFEEVNQLSDRIFKHIKKFKRVFIHIDSPLNTMFIMFSRSEDKDLLEIMDLIIETDGNA